MIETVMLRALAVDDLSEIAAVHIAAFPSSALTQLGRRAVERYYAWQLTGPHQVSAVGAWDQERLVGFCFGGTFRGALEGFLRANRRILALAVVRRPWLVVTNPLFRERLVLASKILTKKLKRKRAHGKSQTAAPGVPSYGILSIAVDPTYQGHGVGRALMSEADQIARARGFTRMALTVDTDNQQAIRFYERSGWVRVSQNGAWNGHMEKLLTSEYACGNAKSHYTSCM